MPVNLVLNLFWALLLGSVAANTSLVDRTVHDAQGTSENGTIQAIERALADISLEKRDTVFENSTMIAKSWNDATLFTMLV